MLLKGLIGAVRDLGRVVVVARVAALHKACSHSVVAWVHVELHIRRSTGRDRAISNPIGVFLKRPSTTTRASAVGTTNPTALSRLSPQCLVTI